jgi:hypothetical protein
MHQVTPGLVLRELDRLLENRAQMKPSPWSVVFPDENPSHLDDEFVVLS